MLFHPFRKNPSSEKTDENRQTGSRALAKRIFKTVPVPLRSRCDQRLLESGYFRNVAEPFVEEGGFGLSDFYAVEQNSHTLPIFSRFDFSEAKLVEAEEYDEESFGGRGDDRFKNMLDGSGVSIILLLFNTSFMKFTKSDAGNFQVVIDYHSPQSSFTVDGLFSRLDQTFPGVTFRDARASGHHRAWDRMCVLVLPKTFTSKLAREVGKVCFSEKEVSRVTVCSIWKRVPLKIPQSEPRFRVLGLG